MSYCVVCVYANCVHEHACCVHMWSVCVLSYSIVHVCVLYMCNTTKQRLKGASILLVVQVLTQNTCFLENMPVVILSKLFLLSPTRTQLYIPQPCVYEDAMEPCRIQSVLSPQLPHLQHLISTLHHVEIVVNIFKNRLLITGYYAELTSYTSIGVTAGKGAEALLNGNQ